MLNRKEISGLIRYKLVQIYKAIEEYADLGQVLPQLREGKMTFSRRWFNHVVHLTE